MFVFATWSADVTPRAGAAHCRERMTASESPNPPPRSSWPRAFTAIVIVALLVGGAVFVAREIIHAPAAVVDKTAELIDRGGARLRSVAEAFRTGTLRTEFLSQATEVMGTSRFQFATLKQAESFKREEAGSTAWGLLPLPKVVVQAQAPVEYSYFLDFAEPWEFIREGDTLMVYPPAITPNTPALDVSALTFFTLEGSVWRDESVVREKLRASLTQSLEKRAVENTKLVREVGRQRLATFVEKWLIGRYSDGASVHVKVVFPDERTAAPDAKKL